MKKAVGSWPAREFVIYPLTGWDPEVLMFKKRTPPTVIIEVDGGIAFLKEKPVGVKVVLIDRDLAKVPHSIPECEIFTASSRVSKFRSNESIIRKTCPD